MLLNQEDTAREEGLGFSDMEAKRFSSSMAPAAIACSADDLRENARPTEKTAARRRELKCRVHPLSSLATYKYVVVCSWYQGRWLLSRHKKRNTWETQGGHIEADESPMQAAERELYEESGVKDAAVYPVCDYYGFDSVSSSNGMVFLAVIRTLGDLPESEMRETGLFERLPENLTYPDVTPCLIARAEGMLKSLS